MRIPEALDRAEKLFARKEKRARQAADFSIAGAEYQQKQQRQLDNLGRLRQLRLDREQKVAERAVAKTRQATKGASREHKGASREGRRV